MKTILLGLVLIAGRAAAQNALWIELSGQWRAPTWLRRRVELPQGANRSELAITLGAIQDVYDVEVYGSLTGASGDFHSFSETEIPRPRTFAVPSGVEAANAARELFGFERARAVSGQPAAAIASAAKAWGQDVDITVVTIRRLL